MILSFCFKWRRGLARVYAGGCLKFCEHCKVKQGFEKIRALIRLQTGFLLHNKNLSYLSVVRWQILGMPCDLAQ